MLLLLGAWRYLYKRHPLRYDPVYWAAVFPLGMYAAATHEMALALDLGFLSWVPRLFFWIALLSWTAALAGLVLGARFARH
jgi:tellurite resistance protein TehA-like permease